MYLFLIICLIFHPSSPLANVPAATGLDTEVSKQTNNVFILFSILVPGCSSEEKRFAEDQSVTVPGKARAGTGAWKSRLVVHLLPWPLLCTGVAGFILAQLRAP